MHFPITNPPTQDIPYFLGRKEAQKSQENPVFLRLLRLFAAIHTLFFQPSPGVPVSV